MKKNNFSEDYGLILSIQEKKGVKIARILGTKHFRLAYVTLNENTDFKIQDKILITRDSDDVDKINEFVTYDDLNKAEKYEVEKAIHSIIIANQNEYIKFFNKQSKEASRLHLLDGISRKLGFKILTEKELNGDFTSFEDIDKRVKFIKDSEELIFKRVLHEMSEVPHIKKGRPVYLFAYVKRTNKKEVKKYDEFLEDDSNYIKMMKEKGLIEKEGKKLRY